MKEDLVCGSPITYEKCIQLLLQNLMEGGHLGWPRNEVGIVHWICVAHDSDQCLAVVNVGMNFQGPYMVGNFYIAKRPLAPEEECSI
jgi:hypothetical protein